LTLGLARARRRNCTSSKMDDTLLTIAIPAVCVVALGVVIAYIRFAQERDASDNDDLLLM